MKTVFMTDTSPLKNNNNNKLIETLTVFF